MPECNIDETLLFEQIYGDKNRLIQVIVNFLSNSLKFSNVNSEIKLHLKILEQQNVKDAL